MLTALLLAASVALAAPKEVVLSDGQVLIGEVEEAEDGIVLVLGDGERLPLPATAIASIGDAPDADAGPRDANRSRYFYGPSAFSLGKGHGYLAQRALVLSSAGYGIVDGWDIEVGSVLPTAFFPEAFVGFVGTKVSGQVADRVRLMGGAQLAFLAGEAPLMLGFVGATFGDEDRHLSLTTGPGLAFHGKRTFYPADPNAEPREEPWGADLGVWITAVSYVHRLGPKAALVSENWIIGLTGDDIDGPWGGFPVFVAPSGGVRLLAERYAVDLGVVPLVAMADEVPLIPVPWVSFDWAW